MNRSCWIALFAAVLLAGCGKPQAQQEADTTPAALPPEAHDSSPLDRDTAPRIRSFDWSRRIGIAAVQHGRQLVFAAPDDALPPGTLVTLVWLDEPQHFSQARILALNRQPWVIAGQPVEGSAYELQAEAIDSKQGGYAIAITGETGAPAISGENVVIDLDGDGENETFRQCSSAEGLHLTVWSGPPLTSPQDWHRYLYLGQELQVTCSETEAAGQ